MNTANEGRISPDRAREVIADAMLDYAKAGKVSLMDIELLQRTVVSPARPWMGQKEFMQRQERWGAEEISDERMRGRIEGQLQAFEMYLLRLTGMGLSHERIIEMLGNDIKSHEMMADYAADKQERKQGQAVCAAPECAHPLSEHDSDGCNHPLPREDWCETAADPTVYCGCTAPGGRAS